MDRPRKIRSGWPLAIATVVLGGLGVVLIWFLAARLEGQGPSVTLGVTSPLYLGASAEVGVALEDADSGLRRFQAGLSKDGKEFPLADVHFPTSGPLGLEKVRRDTVRLKIDPAAMKLSDGRGVLRIAVWDCSWRSWWHGNSTELQAEVVIDTRVPVIEVLTSQNYVNQGGAGLAVYRLSEPCPETGLRVGGAFYPGYSGHYADPNVHIAFFAVDYAQGSAPEMVLEARDQAGNRTRSRFPCQFRKKAFKKDTLSVSDGFISQILPEFESLLPQAANSSLKEKFLFINRDLRQANYRTIVEAARKSRPAMLWGGAFLRLPNAAPRAGFADQRTYLYAGKEIDQQVHLGVDLASLTHSPVPAANSGVVAYAGRLGIYGETVLLDHGFGVFSMYSHLSQIRVKIGDNVAKEDILGNTGSTGLAGGDHLHFSILVHDTFVNPVEWWDAHWIQDNITLKLDVAKGG